jgi:phage gpG-like protein
MKNFYKNIASDLRVELLDEFDQNFTRKAFFDKAWPEVMMPNRRGTLMMRSGALRRSIRAQSIPGGVGFSSSLPYAKIQNEGGTIKVTTKMKRFFWAMYYSIAGKTVFSIKKKQAANTKKNKALSVEAEYWKALALKKVGSKLTIKQRQFIGHHPQVDIAVRRVIDDNFQDVKKEIKNTFKP